ncbi:tRNA (guanosine(37)-N1)-methyltransferase TrmD [Candidatus Dependentiae bacterium]|nr:tRNA (guanosine(37)-N1)-methyltransferase TrmD [Candidatus Dependentiae bacterium]
MRISVLTLFPQLYQQFLSQSIIGKAGQKGLLTVDLVGLFQFEKPGNRIDSPTFGHGAGMLIRPDIVQAGIDHAEQAHGPAFKIFFSPQGQKLDQQLLATLYQQLHNRHLVLVASRYEGIDARVEQKYADLVLSIGDYVLMGGDLPAMVFMESFLRFMPGIIGKSASVEHDSFMTHLVDYPEYTAPVVWEGMAVPEVVRSGNHGALAQWREQQAYAMTVRAHFDWLRSFVLTKEQMAKARAAMPRHYVVLMHDQVRLKGGAVGTSSVTSLDIHDIARSATTYGIEKYYIVTPLRDQQQIVKTLLNFWHCPAGKEYNQHRHTALQKVELQASLAAVMADIEAREGKKPIVIGTCARRYPAKPELSYYDQRLVWQQERPVLILLGTSHGLAESVIEQCDYMLLPISGMTDFNHLSVRSAAAVILDRWLGLQPKYLPDRSKSDRVI